MVFRTFGVATGPAELEPYRPQATHGFLVASVLYFLYWLACLSGWRLKLIQSDQLAARHVSGLLMFQKSYKNRTDVYRSMRYLGIPNIDRDTDSYLCRLSITYSKNPTVQYLPGASVHLVLLIPLQYN